MEGDLRWRSLGFWGKRGTESGVDGTASKIENSGGRGYEITNAWINLAILEDKTKNTSHSLKN